MIFIPVDANSQHMYKFSACFGNVSGTIAYGKCWNICLRTIKKYQNRRLYDTQLSTYVTLEKIREMIINGEEFSVVDAKNASDVTHHVLLQIIGERETQAGTSMLSNELLSNLIRFYGDSLQGVMGEYLESSVNKFVERQDLLRNQVHTILDTPGSPATKDDSPKTIQ